MLSLQGFTPIWGFYMIIYTTFRKETSQIGANLSLTLKNIQTKHSKTKRGTLGRNKFLSSKKFLDLENKGLTILEKNKFRNEHMYNIVFWPIQP